MGGRRQHRRPSRSASRKGGELSAHVGAANSRPSLAVCRVARCPSAAERFSLNHAIDRRPLAVPFAWRSRLGFDGRLLGAVVRKLAGRAGVTLHAATGAGPMDEHGREALLEYVLRPPVAVYVLLCVVGRLRPSTSFARSLTSLLARAP